jgi:uncharacterized membrane protein YphA (DoxX/SURF4 family)
VLKEQPNVMVTATTSLGLTHVTATLAISLTLPGIPAKVVSVFFIFFLLVFQFIALDYHYVKWQL